MLDHAITGGTVVDGTGSSGAAGRRRHQGRPHRRRRRAPSELDGGGQTIDATDLVVTPGFVDPHTHYDAQLYWDPLATPSSWHGVTSVIGGNCGFTLAPLKERDADYTRRMMAQVEGMPLVALEQGVPWKWETFGEYLAGLDGAPGRERRLHGRPLRAAPLRAGRGLQAGVHARGAGAASEVLLRQSLAAGGLGLSTTRSTTHVDGNGDPVPSRFASEDEVLALCEVVGRVRGHVPGGHRAGLPAAGSSDEEVELLARMSGRGPPAAQLERA